LSFAQNEFTANGNIQRMVDERTNLVSYYFDGDSHLSTSTNFGGFFTISFWAQWSELRSWSRIIDFGVGRNDNFVIANEGGSRHLIVSLGQGN